MSKMKKRSIHCSFKATEEELNIIHQKIFDLLTNHGYGTNRVAQYLNGKGIKTKNGTSFWRGTSIRAIIENPIYIGIYHMQGVQSESFDHLKIIEEDLLKSTVSSAARQKPL